MNVHHYLQQQLDSNIPSSTDVYKWHACGRVSIKSITSSGAKHTFSWISEVWRRQKHDDSEHII